MEKRRPHYDLNRIKELFQIGSSRLVTGTALDHAAELHLYRADIVECVLELTHREFYKSMTSHHDHRLWQDVYHPTFRERQLYVKIQISPDGKAVVVQFKAKEEQA